MKINFLHFKKIILSAIILFSISIMASATTYTAIASGNWSSSSTWGVTAPSFTNTSDQIIIPSGITVSMDNNVTLNGALALLNVEGSLSSGSTTTLTVTNGSITGAGIIDIGNAYFGVGAVVPFTGNFTANTLVSSVSSLQTTAKVTINQSITLTSGILTVINNGTLTLGNNANIIIDGGKLLNNGGVFVLTSNYNVSYLSGTLATGIELTGAGLKNLTIDVLSSNTVTLSNDVIVNGNLSLISGNLSLGIKNLTLKGDVTTPAAGIIRSTSASDITITSPAGLTGTLNFGTAANAVNNFTLNISDANHAQISGSLTINGTLALTSGTLNLSSSNLTIAGDIASAGTGKLSTTATSNLIINSAASLTGTLRFINGNNTLNNLTVNIAGGGTMKIGSDLNIEGILNLNSGRIDIGSNKLNIAASGTIMGAGSTSYIITADSGQLTRLIPISATATTFPVGTSVNYYPADIIITTGFNTGRMGVGVSSNVLAWGTTGVDMSITQHLVDATWFVKADFATNMNLSLKVSWPTASEVNGFVRSSSYISHYVNGNWDVVATSAAAASGTGMYSSTRANITSLSPFSVFDQNTVTAIQSKAVYATFALYPNPANDKLILSNFDVNSSIPTLVKIINTKGEVVSSQMLDVNQSTISLLEIESGYYILQIQNDNINVTKKFVKM